jgi:pyruvate dehydrogenase E2 component (dihydrolipoamide acetyltransferase)
MASGSLAEWYVSEGDKFSAGDALAKIETDKATIDFEAQDDGYVARLLMEAATGNDVSVGTPIMVTVEEEENIAAFKDYVAPPSQKVASEVTPSAAESALSPTPPPPPPPSALAAALAPKEPSAAAASSAPSSPAPPAPAAVVSPPSVFPSSSAPSTPAVVPWGSMVATSSPLARTLSKSQRKYVELYGSTGQVPIL